MFAGAEQVVVSMAVCVWHSGQVMGRPSDFGSDVPVFTIIIIVIHW